MDPDSDPDPAIFVIDLQVANKELILFYFSAYYFLKVHLHYSSEKKSQKESQNSRKQGFSYHFCMIEGSGSGSIPLTNGSGSGSATLVFGSLVLLQRALNPSTVALPGLDCCKYRFRTLVP